MYEEIPNASEANSGGKKKWLVAAALFAVIGVVYGSTSMRSDPDQAIKKALASNKGVQVKANGKLKLFDEFSKSQSYVIRSTLDCCRPQTVGSNEKK